MEQFYKNSYEHLCDELLLVDLVIHAQVIKFRQDNSSRQNAFHGLYITEDEIDSLLAESPDYNKWVNSMEGVSDEYEKVSMAAGQLSSIIKTRILKSREMGINLKLLNIASLYDLNSFEVNIFLLCLAAQFSGKYRKLFSYLQDDVTKKNPCVELILNMVCKTFNEKTEARRYFSQQAPLFKNNIIQFIEDRNDPDKPVISRELKVNDRIVGYILDETYLSDDLSVFSKIYDRENTFSDTVIQPEIKGQLQNFVSFCRSTESRDSFIFSFYGTDETQKHETAGAICNELGVPLLVIDLHALNNSDLYFERGIDLVLRESEILNSAIYLKNADFIFSSDPEFDDHSYIRKYLISEFDKYSMLTFISTSEFLPVHGEFSRQKLISIEMPVPEYSLRKEIWSRYLSECSTDGSVDPKEIAGKYNLTAGQIRDVVATAGISALWREGYNGYITQKDLDEACHVHSNQKLRKLAQRIKPARTWDDIILDSRISGKLREIVKMFKNKHQVYDEWGFDKKFSLGKGISALFFGEPGTGKTLAAEIMASELGMDLYKIDISTVVSKYIGETEKNLSKIFNEAETSNSILFFDEADSLFGKRTEVKDSHDRYSNIEVSYLLQRIDEYDGVVIMATNYSKNIDEAFERRLHFIINFPFPDEASRMLIWQNAFTGKIPLDKNIDFRFLAKKFEISGGNIKNIALQSAFYAADSGGALNMDHILKACRGEYEKIGRLWQDG